MTGTTFQINNAVLRHLEVTTPQGKMTVVFGPEDNFKNYNNKYQNSVKAAKAIYAASTKPQFLNSLSGQSLEMAKKFNVTWVQFTGKDQPAIEEVVRAATNEGTSEIDYGKLDNDGDFLLRIQSVGRNLLEQSSQVAEILTTPKAVESGCSVQ